MMINAQKKINTKYYSIIMFLKILPNSKIMILFISSHSSFSPFLFFFRFVLFHRIFQIIHHLFRNILRNLHFIDMFPLFNAIQKPFGSYYFRHLLIFLNKILHSSYNPLNDKSYDPKLLFVTMTSQILSMTGMSLPSPN